MAFDTRTVQLFTAIRAIAPSTVRGQGAPGVVAACRQFLAALDVKEFTTTEAKRFRRCLDALLKHGYDMLEIKSTV